MLIVQLSLLLVTLYCVNAQLSGIARFDTRNLRGYVRFTELENGNVEIRTNFSDLPFDDALPYHVHLYPVDYRYDPTVRCGASYTGGHFDPTDRLGDTHLVTGTQNSAARVTEQVLGTVLVTNQLAMNKAITVMISVLLTGIYKSVHNTLRI